MRKEPFAYGDFVHVFNRGVRKMPITRDENDKWRFLKLLYYLNDKYCNDNWEREVYGLGHGLHFKRPSYWPARQPLTAIVAYCLMPNHFHLFLNEIENGGIAKFMQKIGNSMTGHFNLKYKESGSMFQGSYKAKRVKSDNYFARLSTYIMVKNSFELYPNGGLKKATQNFERAYKWASRFDFCSLADYSTKRLSPILTKRFFNDVFPDEKEFKIFSKSYIEDMIFGDEELE